MDSWRSWLPSLCASSRHGPCGGPVWVARRFSDRIGQIGGSKAALKSQGLVTSAVRLPFTKLPKFRISSEQGANLAPDPRNV